MLVDLDKYRKVFSVIGFGAMLPVVLLFPSYADASGAYEDRLGGDGIVDTHVVNFDDVTDLGEFFVADSESPVFINAADAGLNDSGSVTVPVPSNEIWTSKYAYSSGVGATYTLGAYFKIAIAPGRGALGLSRNVPSTGGIYSTPAVGIAATYHGGGGEIISNGSVVHEMSWPPDLVWGNWYYMTFAVENKGDNTFDLTVEIYETDATGRIGALKTSQSYDGLVNSEMGSAPEVHGFFSASDTRMDRIDDYSITIDGGASFVGEADVADVLPVTDVSTSSVSTGATVVVSGGVPITARGFCYGTSAEPTTADTCTADGSGAGAFTSTLTDLTASTMYYARPYVTTVDGSVYGSEMTFVTRDNAPSVPDLVSTSDTGESEVDDFTADSTPTLQIECNIGSTVHLTTTGPSADTVVTTTHPCDDGDIEITTSNLVDGSYQFSVTQTNASGVASDTSATLAIVIDTAAASTVSQSSDAPVAVYRFWSDVYKSHFYTQSSEERDQVIAQYDDATWLYEGEAFQVFGEMDGDRLPVYRFWSPTNKSHFYTSQEQEKDIIIDTDANWEYEGIGWYVTDSDVVTYRFYSPVYKSHFYTQSSEERDQVIADDANWQYEGEVLISVQ